MARAAQRSGARRAAAARARARDRPLEPGEVAWILAAPCGLAVVASIVLLGPLLGGAFPTAAPDVFWPSVWLAPEPTEHARYLISLLGPPLLAAAVLASTRLSVNTRPAAIRALVVAGQWMLVAFLVVCMLAEHHLILGSLNRFLPAQTYFPPLTLATAAVVPLVLLVLLGRRSVAERVVRWVRETRTRRVACLVLAGLLTATWLLTAINSDGTIGYALGNNLFPWDMNETYAVLDGRTPLVDFHAQYGQLWPYGIAAVLAVVGSSFGVWTTLMATLSGLALLAVYAVFRRILRSSPLALAVYLPFMATGFFVYLGTLANRLSPAGIFSLWPMRYGGAYLLAWLTARHVDRAAPRRMWVLFLVAGLVALNNPEFGGPALVATLAAVGYGTPPRSWQAAARLLGTAVGGVVGAGLLIVVLTLVRAGQLPRFELLLEFPRFYAVGGWTLEPMPVIGLHVVVYVTFGAAIAAATVRAANAGEERLLTGMLAWSGVFGLLVGAYYAARSDRLDLIALFSAWCFALALLLILVMRGLAARSWRRPTLPELAVLFGFGVAFCSLAQIPTPWSQVARWRKHTSVPLFMPPDVLHMIARDTKPGSEVAILAPMGHRLAYDLGRTNISPYSGVESMPTRRQVHDTIDLLRRKHVHRVFLSIGDVTPGNIFGEVAGAFVQAGFSLRTRVATMVELTDDRPGSK